MRCGARFDRHARLSVAIMIVLVPALLLYVLRGAAWQIDMHMYFFVALASLTILCDWRPLVLGAALIAVHHVLLSLTTPSWVLCGQRRPCQGGDPCAGGRPAMHHPRVHDPAAQGDDRGADGGSA